jgi:hypothetical protein
MIRRVFASLALAAFVASAPAAHAQSAPGDSYSGLKTDDQSGSIITATYQSMSAFMKNNSLLQETYILSRER